MSVPGKKTTKPSRSIRYLLSADRTLQRLSLRRLSKRAKKERQSTQSNRSRSAARANASPGSWSISARAIALAVICIAATAALIAARQPSPSASVASVDAPVDATVSLEQVPARVEPKKTVAAKAPVSTSVKTSAAPLSKPKTPAKAPAVESVMTEPASSTTKADVSDSAPLTISGCLQADGQSFWLKDTSGMDAPRSRSWRSGFLRKRSVSVDVVPASNTLKLTNYVGQRVEATGTLLDREMRVRSLRSLGDCK
jgi:cytoskeletal protein RodZ